MRFSARPVMVLSFALAAAASGCHGRNDSATQHPTQGAVGTAIQRVQNSVASAVDPRGLDAPHAQDSATMPSARVEGMGLGAHAMVQDDAAHENVTAARTGEGWALTWNDAAHSRAFMAQMDANGQPTGAPTVIRESRSDEEDVVAPSAAFNGSEYGLAWVDPANGRVRFKRMTRDGHAIGRATIVHEGLEMPEGSRIAWNGSEYGIAVAMHTGVYFARVNREGARLGEVIVADGPMVGGIDELTVSQNGFQVAWHEGGESAGVRHEARISRDGQVSSAAGRRMPTTRLASR